MFNVMMLRRNIFSLQVISFSSSFSQNLSKLSLLQRGCQIGQHKRVCPHKKPMVSWYSINPPFFPDQATKKHEILRNTYCRMQNTKHKYCFYPKHIWDLYQIIITRTPTKNFRFVVKNETTKLICKEIFWSLCKNKGFYGQQNCQPTLQFHFKKCKLDLWGDFVVF